MTGPLPFLSGQKASITLKWLSRTFQDGAASMGSDLRGNFGALWKHF